MASFSYQIIPFSFLFIILIIYLATKTPPPKKKIVNKLASDFEISRPFLEDAENKLVALRDLYKQELIDAEIYIRKTDDCRLLSEARPTTWFWVPFVCVRRPKGAEIASSRRNKE